MSKSTDRASTLSTGDDVGLEGLGDGLESTYYVKGVTHKTDGDGSDTSFDTGH